MTEREYLKSIKSGRDFARYSPNALSHSRLKVLQSCPRRYYIEYERGMERIGQVSQGLRMGAAFAMALQFSDPKMPFKETYEILLSESQSQSEIDMYMIESATVEYYAGKYIEIYGACDLREIEYQFPLVDTFTFRGAVDGIIYRNEKPIAVEDKFLGQWNETRQLNLPLDTQITSEIFGLRTAAYDVSECLYRVTLKPRIIRKKGRGKDATPETVTEYVSRIIETVEAAPEEYFLEFHETRDNDQLDDWLKDTIAYAEQIDFLRAQGRFPKSKDTCNIYAGGCGHREICSSIPSAVSLYQTKEGYPTNDDERQNGNSKPNSYYAYGWYPTLATDDSSPRRTKDR